MVLDRIAHSGMATFTLIFMQSFGSISFWPWLGESHVRAKSECACRVLSAQGSSLRGQEPGSSLCCIQKHVHKNFLRPSLRRASRRRPRFDLPRNLSNFALHHLLPVQKHEVHIFPVHHSPHTHRRTARNRLHWLHGSTQGKAINPELCLSF